MPQRLSVTDLLNKKKRGEKITMLTAYDYPLALLLDTAGIDVILVGDSLANVVLGFSSTREVGMEEMLHHAKAVNRAVKKALLIGDLPYEAYQTKTADAVKNARRFVEEAGCGAVKLEWFDRCPDVAGEIIRSGVPVMGHVGLTPQTVDRLGGFKVQGQDVKSAQAILGHARDLEKLGCFSIVLECIPDQVAAKITQELSIPTIGIGAGVHCDGQVLVTHDLLGLSSRFHPKFVKEYAHLDSLIRKAVEGFQHDVRGGVFPDKAHSFTMKEEEWKKLKS